MRMKVRVGKNGHFSTVSEAVQAVPYETPAIIYVEAGIYKEKIFCEKKEIEIVGDGMESTVIEYDDGAFDVLPDGTKRGTFRSYTAFFSGEKVTVKNMTIRNTAGDGSVAGQALAVYADSKKCYYENVKLEGHQDTLFMSPLPVSERQKNGFMGPRVLTPRINTKQYYKNCVITGDVDFIFGGADAVFDDCRIICNDRTRQEREAKDACPEDDKVSVLSDERYINGYITAPCGAKDGLGMIFRRCVVKGEEGSPKASVFLSRPWRDEAKTVYLDCTMDDTIAPERFSGWGAIDKVHEDTFYGEFGSVYEDGKRISLGLRNSWVKEIDEREAKRISAAADELIKSVKRENE
ncbi:pectinesterase family protein [Butyrivibrio sp. YAB3001]|uniref:pectinesterase family protein n=1 Tax=Butyrivibrio sp. YAB3001 TaxID=1520812 RepID=UPI0008F62412|nr:pectinesterase family protein [Butyrivibrio sp. YAB3001]SFB87836.1 pectinesterase [Butyrivibrio sp. YAB3001]